MMSRCLSDGQTMLHRRSTMEQTSLLVYTMKGWFSITALPLSAADMGKSWHKNFTQDWRDLHVRSLVDAMSSVDPVEDIKDLETDAQNIERNIYESANSEYGYWELMIKKSSELEKKTLKSMKKKMKSMGQTSTPPLTPGDKPHQVSASTRKPHDFTNEPGPSHTNWDSITALPLSEADMRKSWHKNYRRYLCDFYVRSLVEYMSTGDPAEDIKDLVADAENIERNMYESANGKEEYCKLMDEKMSELMEKSMEMSMRLGSASAYGSKDPSPLSLIEPPQASDKIWDSITALPLSAVDMRKSWHKNYPQYHRDYHVRWLAEDVSTGDPAEDIKDLVNGAQNIERNIYESANSKDDYWKLMNEKRYELMAKKSQMKMEMKRSGQMEMKSSTPTLPPGDKQDEEGGAEGESMRVKGQPDVKMEEKPEGTIPLHGEMEDHPVTESRSSLHPSLELQDETDLSSCFSGLRIEESISLPCSHSLPALGQIPCLENKTSFRAKRSHSLNDVTLLDKTQKITPDIIVVENKESYRFRCTQAGLFQCNVTGLVFKMETEGYVTYRTLHWDRGLLSQLSKKPGGPLFDIKGSQGSVCQLHFPHCEILSMGGGKSLYVVHVMDDERIELIYPDVITETHVIINVTGFSPYGVVNDEDSTNPIWANVALFFTPPNGDDDSTLKVLLLPRNVVLDEVKNKRRKLVGEEIYIEKPPCTLIPNQEYNLSSSPQHDSITIEPLSAVFEVHDSYQNYIVTFEVILEERFKRITLLLSNSNTSNCQWKGNVKLSGPYLRKEQVQRTLSLEVEERLYSVRDSFIDSVSLPNLNCLLDKLFAKEVLTDAERETGAEIQAKKEKARFVVDTVRRKGPDASSSMILILCDLDTCLSKHLGLM